jgi:hypothetical protein
MEEITRDTAAWRFQVWASFLIASAVTLAGIGYLPVDTWMRGFLLMGVLFVVGSCFSLAKTLRDDHEARRLLNRLADAKAEKIIREYELGAERAAAKGA